MAKPNLENFTPAAQASTDASDALRNDFFTTSIGKISMPSFDAVSAPARGDYPAPPPSISAESWGQVQQWIAADKQVNFTSAGEGPVPDYYLGSDGKLVPNPAKTAPNPDGSVTVQVESAQGNEAAKQAARELAVAAVESKIAYWQRANPGKDVPHFLKAMLSTAQSSGGDAAAQSKPQPEQRAAQPQQAPQQDAPAPASQPSAARPSFGGPGSQSVGNRNIGSAPSSGYRPGSFEPNGPIDRSAIPRPVEGDLAIKGPPSANPEQIQTFLEKMGSPAAREEGFSQALYDACTKRGIDPAVAVGFFLQESTCGRYGRAHDNKSLGNIKGSAPESGGSDGTFRRYNTWAEGARDWARLIDESYVQKRGLETLSQVISVYAPASDNNNERRYVSTVKGVVENFKNQNNGTSVA